MSAEPISFQAQLRRPAEGGDWTFLRLPKEASDPLPSRGQVSVEGTMNGVAFQTTLQPDGDGGHWLKAPPSLLEKTHVEAGDAVPLAISPMAVEPEPEAPEDLLAALAADSAAQATWSATTPVARRDWIQWLTSGKRAETRTIRLDKMTDMLAKGKRRICCFDRSGRFDKSLSCPAAAPDED